MITTRNALKEEDMLSDKNGISEVILTAATDTEWEAHLADVFIGRIVQGTGDLFTAFGPGIETVEFESNSQRACAIYLAVNFYPFIREAG